MSFAIFIPVFYLHFVLAFLKVLNEKKLVLIFTYILFSIFFSVNLFTTQFISDVKSVSSFTFWPIPALLFHPFLFIWVIYVIYATKLLHKKQIDSRGFEKMQSKYILLGMIIGFIGGSTNYFLWYQIPIPPLGNILVSVYVAMTAYAIIRHSFLDIRLVIARSIAYTLLIFILGAIYAFGLFFIGSIFIGSATNGLQLVTSTILAVAMAFTFQPLRSFLEKATDKIFYKGHYDSNQLLSTLATIMSTTIELKPLTGNLLQVLTKEMRITKGAFVIFGEGLASIYDITSVGYTKNLNYTYSQISNFFPFKETLVFDQMEENHIKGLVREIEASVIKVLRVEGRVVGALILGDKASGEIYSEQDLKVIEILAPEISIAIQNSQSYDKIKKFNIVLSEEVKKATSDLQTANERLKVLDRLKDDFVSIASHELRTPMTAVRSYAWMALHRSDIPLSEKLKKYLSRTLTSTERLINLVNDMLNVSRIESGKIEINPAPFDLTILVKEVIEEVSAKAQERKIYLEVLEYQLPKVFADSDKVHQVLLNLVGNSLKFTPSEGKITILFFSDGHLVETSIKDTGPGISKDDISRLFQKFGRLDSSYIATATSGGTGLGLYISKKLIDLMHGKIWASSEGIGKGATFTFSLPLATKEILENADKFKVRPVGEAKGLEPVAI